jgi:ABC-2 type transport system ATP-binding protein
MSVAAGDGTGGQTGEVVVTVRGLSKRFPVRRRIGELLLHPLRRETAPALTDIHCIVHAAEFFGLLGPNGAGKTTFLKILATLVLPDDGEAHVCGHDVRRDPAAVRRLTAPCLATERSLYWRLTARENLALAADLLGVARQDVDARIDEALVAVDLRDTGSKLVGQFSSGMMQRLLIARALLARPRLLLLDEPTRSLDPVAAREFRRFLQEELVVRRGCAVILATHNAEEALQLCHRVGILHRGRLLSTGTTEELSRRYVGASYRLVTREPSHAALRDLLDQGVLRVESTGEGPGADGWSTLLVRLPEGEEQAAGVLGRLVAGGMVVSRFEAVAPSLADLITAVVDREGAVPVAAGGAAALGAAASLSPR